jgi:glycolate oxidase
LPLQDSKPLAKSNYAPVTEAIVSQLQNICGAAHVEFENEKALQRYSRDQVPADNQARLPEVVVKPKSAEEVAAVLQLANRENIPVTPRAAGSGLSGGAVPIFGGILLSIERMDRILEIDTANLMAVVQPGVVTNRLDAALAERGLFFAGYPMSEEFCFIGGNVAENAGGGRAIKYGVTGRYIHGLEVVTPTGDIVHLGGKRIKDVTGYDLVHLMVGSEGTLGIFTKITVKLLPRPTHRTATLALFPDVASAISAIPDVMTSGRLIPTAIEYMDRFSFTSAAKDLKKDFPYEQLGAALLFEVDGNSADGVAAEAATIAEICEKRGAVARYVARQEKGIEAFWNIRKQIPWVLKRYSPQQSVEDIVVPIAEIPTIVSLLQEIAKKHDTLIPVFGHAGDGNLHATPMKNPQHSQAHWEAMLPELKAELYRATAQLGGTISGEHGIGHKRRDFMKLVMSEAELELLRRIKTALDPKNILNPGKIIPDAG